MHINKLMDSSLLNKMLDEKYLRTQAHPSGELVIYNYTEKAQFDNEWNEVTRQCRGLITDNDGNVVALPFKKFFNWGQVGCPELSLDDAVVVHDKMDGSLGILYRGPDGTAMATRGSFTSDQAVHATRILRERYPEVDGLSGLTLLFEIVYPENRIVLDYGGADDLFLLGAVRWDTGEYVRPDLIDESLWPGPRVRRFDYGFFGEALEAPPRENAEGLVVYVPHLNEFVKIKQEDYVTLHKIIFNLSARGVWERMGEGDSAEKVCMDLPDEFHAWVRDVAQGLENAYFDILQGVDRDYTRILGELEPDFSRKDFALKAKDSPNKAYLFALLDGKPISEMAWKTLRPSAEEKPFYRSEDDS